MFGSFKSKLLRLSIINFVSSLGLSIDDAQLLKLFPSTSASFQTSTVFSMFQTVRKNGYGHNTPSIIDYENLVTW